MPNHDTKDHYTVLGISPDATQDEIRAAYMRRAKILHPDRFNFESQSNDWKQANEMLRELNAAFHTLGDEARRRQYDTRQTSTRSDDSQHATNNRKVRVRFSHRTSTQSDDSQHSFDEDPESGNTSNFGDLLSCGEAYFDTLPPESQRSLKSRQNGAKPNQFSEATDIVAWNYAALLVFMGWYWYLFSQIKGVYWGISTLLWYYPLTAFVSFLVIYNVFQIACWHASILKSYFYVTPLYFIETEYDKVRYWPIWQLKDVDIKHKYNEGKYQSSEVTFDLDQAKKKLTLTDQSEVRRLGKLLTTFSESFKESILRGDLAYFRQNDDFYGVSSASFDEVRGVSHAVRYAAYLGAAAIGSLLVLATTHANHRHVANGPKRHEYPEPVAKAEAGADSLDSRRSNTSSSSNMASKPVPALPVKPLPPNGDVQIYHSQEAIAPLKIVTRFGASHYFVKIAEWDSERTVATLFVHAGQAAETELPLGSYRIKYATGSTWYGPNYLFGQETQYAIADEKFVFAHYGNRVQGYTLELYSRLNGNLKSKPIDAEDW